MNSSRPIQRGNTILSFVGVVALMALSVWMMFWNLGASSISVASDEVIYVRIVQTIIHEGRIFPLFHGKLPSFEKPPLALWSNALIPWIFGESNWSFRSLSAGLGLCSLAISVLLARRIFGSMIGALVVGFLLLGVPEWIIAQHGFRRVVLDSILTVMTLGMAVFSWRAVEDHRDGRSIASDLWCIAGLCSLALMTKSVAGFVPLACSIVSIVVNCPRCFSIRRGLIVLLPGVVFGAYLVAIWIVGGNGAIRTFLGTEIVTRTLGGFEGHNTSDTFFYWRYLFSRGAGAPASLLIIGTLGIGIGALRDTRLRFVAVWGFLPVIAYSCAASKTPWYLNPFFPFVCMIAVFGTARFLRALIVPSRSAASRAIAISLVVATALPAYERALSRHIREVAGDTRRLEIDLLVSDLREHFSNFLIVDGCLSGHSTPRNGRFNVEGIYREMLKPALATVPDAADIVPTPGRVVFLKEESLGGVPPGWRELGRLRPYASRKWAVVAIEYAGSSAVRDNL